MMFEGKGSRLSKRIKELAMVVLVVAVLSAVQPFLWRTVNGLAESLNQKRFQVKQISEIMERSKEVEDEYEKQKVFLEQLSAVVPLSRETLQVIERLEGLAKEVGADIQVESIKEGEALVVGASEDSEETTPSAPRRALKKEEEVKKRDEPRLLPLLVTVEIRSNPAVLLRYIEAVEHVQELTTVRSFTLDYSSGADGESTESEYTLSMEVIFYLQDHENKRTD